MQYKLKFAGYIVYVKWILLFWKFAYMKQSLYKSSHESLHENSHESLHESSHESLHVKVHMKVCIAQRFP